MIYVYAVAEGPPDPPPQLAGIDDRPLEMRACGGVGVALSRHAPGGAVRPTPENVWRHEAAIEALMRDRAVLPARFNTTFADDASLDAAIAGRMSELTTSLERVRGCVELGLRVLWRAPEDSSVPAPTAPAAPPADAAAAGAGRAYMLARLAEERQARLREEAAARVVGSVHDALAPLARDSTHVIRAAPAPLMTAAYLVARDRTDAFDRQVRQVAAAHPDLRLLCTGPWPPYHFTAPLAPPETTRHA